MLASKNLFCDICDKRITWDSVIPFEFRQRGKKWLKDVPPERAVPRGVTTRREATSAIQVHGLRDASVTGCCLAVYLVIHQSE